MARLDDRLASLRGRAPFAFLAAALSVLVVTVMVRPPPLRADQEFRIDPSQGAQLGNWIGQPPGGFTEGWRFTAGEVRTDYAVFTFQQASSGAETRLELHQRDTLAVPLVRTRQFALRVAPGARPAPPALVETLATSLRAGEPAWHWLEAEQHPTPWWLRRLLHLQVPASAFLLVQMPLWLGLALVVTVRRLALLAAPARKSMVIAVMAAAIMRWLIAPHRLVSLYVGYQLTAQAVTLHPLPRYGAATALFHHALLAVGGPDHRVILWAHSILGVLVVPLLSALASAAFDRDGNRPHVASAAAWLWALLPPVVAHDNSEANTLPLLVWTAAGLILLFEGITQQRRVLLTGAAALLGLAMLGRPEFIVLVPSAALMFGLFALAASTAQPGRSPWLFASAVPLVLAITVLAAPHLAHIGESAALLVRFDSLPLARSPIRNPVGLLDPRLYPAMLVPLALLGALSPARTRRTAFALLVLAALDIMLTRVDLDAANILRVQVPGAMFYVLVAAAGAERLIAFTASASVGPRRWWPRVIGVVAACALLVSAIPSARRSWQPTNEDLEEAFIREARAALPPYPSDLLRVGYADLRSSVSGSPAHLYFPDYLFASASRGVGDIADWERSPPAGRRPAFFYLGVRCYTPERPGEEPARGSLRHACARMFTAHRLTPVVERTVLGRGDPFQTDYYPPAPAPMRLGLYRIEPAQR